MLLTGYFQPYFYAFEGNFNGESDLGKASISTYLGISKNILCKELLCNVWILLYRICRLCGLFSKPCHFHYKLVQHTKKSILTTIVHVYIIILVKRLLYFRAVFFNILLRTFQVPKNESIPLRIATMMNKIRYEIE